MLCHHITVIQNMARLEKKFFDVIQFANPFAIRVTDISRKLGALVIRDICYEVPSLHLYGCDRTEDKPR
jgi:hypothetical protein